MGTTKRVLQTGQVPANSEEKGGTDQGQRYLGGSAEKEGLLEGCR